MWDITKDPMYEKALKEALNKRWARTQNRVADLEKILDDPSGNHHFSLDQLMNVWMNKMTGMKELRQTIAKSKNPLMGIESYVNALIDRWEKPEKILDSLEKYEEPISISAEAFSDKPYEFLNALFAAFPRIVTNTPGLMQQEWLSNAFKPENCSRTAIALISAFQNEFVLPRQNMYGSPENKPFDAFDKKFKDAFGDIPFRIAMKLEFPDRENAKLISGFFKRSTMKLSGRDHNILGQFNHQFAEGNWIQVVIQRSKIAGEKFFVDYFLKLYPSQSSRSSLLERYIVQNLAPLKSFGKLFSESDVNEKHISLLLDRDDDTGLDGKSLSLCEFLAGFRPEQIDSIHSKTKFPYEYIKDQKIKKRAIADDLGI